MAASADAPWPPPADDCIRPPTAMPCAAKILPLLSRRRRGLACVTGVIAVAVRVALAASRCSSFWRQYQAGRAANSVQVRHLPHLPRIGCCWRCLAVLSTYLSLVALVT